MYFKLLLDPYFQVSALEAIWPGEIVSVLCPLTLMWLADKSGSSESVMPLITPLY